MLQTANQNVLSTTIRVHEKEKISLVGFKKKWWDLYICDLAGLRKSEPLIENQFQILSLTLLHSQYTPRKHAHTQMYIHINSFFFSLTQVDWLPTAIVSSRFWTSYSLTCRKLLNGHQWEADQGQCFSQNFLLVSKGHRQLLSLTFCFCPSYNSAKKSTFSNTKSVSF